MTDIIMIIYLLVICSVAAVTDWKKGKIYNKWLMYGALPAMLLVILYYIYNPGFLSLFLMNLASSVIIAVLFFALKLWGAGDSKLWLFVNFLYPAGWYAMMGHMIFPSMLMFMIIFIEAYIYLILESLWYRFRRNKKGVELKKNSVSAEQIWNICFSVLFLSLIYTGLGVWLSEYFQDNRVFFTLIGVLAASKLMELQIKGKKCITVLMLLVYGWISVRFYQGVDARQLSLTVILVVVTHFSLRFAEKYNYEWICTRDVKEGMILSYFAVQQFYGSRVKGLPQTTDETIKSRITEEEAQAILRWEKSKYGQEQIMVVRYIPFAVFILIGIVTYMIGVWSLK